MHYPARTLDRRLLSMWRTIAGLVLAGSVAALSAAAIVTALPWAFAIVGSLAVGAVAFVVPEARYRRWRYELRERDLFLSKGLLFFTLALAPYDRIQFVETRHGPLDRLFGLNQLVVHTAGGKLRIPGLTTDEAERLREELSRVAGTPRV